MALPSVKGWIIDFRTADAIFNSGSNARIDHCLGLCQAGQLHICHHEEDNFRDAPLLKPPFIAVQCCIWEPDEDILEKCIVIKANPVSTKLVFGNEAAIFIAATALCKDLGVISDHSSVKFHTVRDICNTYGIPNYSADQYFSAL